MRYLLFVAVLACGRSESPRKPTGGSAVIATDATVAVAVAVDASPAVEHQRFDDLAQAFAAVVSPHARVVGVGELHARVDRTKVRSALSRFTEALPSFGARVSDLVVETWVVDPKCGTQATQATAKLEHDVKRPVETKSEVTLLAEAARAAGVQPHAMKLSCKDYELIAPAKGPADPVAMLGITTRELSRITLSAIKYRAKEVKPRPWIVVYGGALHNDRTPAQGTAEWSYAETVDIASQGGFVEIDLVAPELAEADTVSQQQPWFPLVAAADRATKVLVYRRGERSFVVILPRTGA